MKKLFMLVVVCLFIVSLPHSPRVYANEVLKITRDHFEFRDAPRVDDETFIGTLRIDTPVEWTGNVSGSWFEVKAPNGQIGWVHSSGLSSPKTPVKQQRQVPEPAPSTSRSPKQRPAAEVSKLQAAVKELEKAKEQSEAQLQEKERRIQELSGELAQLEEKLSDTGQMLEDQEQLRTLNERKLTEAENELLALQGTFKEKDDALLTAKVETTKLQNQLQSLRAQQGSPLSPERIVLGLSLLVNLLGLLFFFMMRKRLSAAKKAVPSMIAEGEPAYQDRPEVERPSKRPPIEAALEEEVEAEMEMAALQNENDERFKELDVVMAAPHSEEELAEEADTSDEVEIDLGDVLPATAGVAAVASDSEPPEHAETEEPLPLETDVIVVEEEIERIDELEEEAVAEAVIEEALPDEESAAEVLLEELPESPAEEPEELLELEEAEAVPETFGGEGEAVEEEEVEELLELEETEEVPGEAEVVEDAEEGEELLELEESEGLLEELEAEELAEVEELPLEVDEESAEAVGENELSEAPPEEIEVSGERFEKLPKSTTQRIESEGEEESSFEEKVEQLQEDVTEENGEDMIIGTPGIIDEDDYENEEPEFESSSETEVGAFEPEENEDLTEGTEGMPEVEEVIEELPETEELVEELSEAEEVIEEQLPETEEHVEEISEVEDVIEEIPEMEEPAEELSPPEPAKPQEFEVEEIVVVEKDYGVSKALHDEREERDIEALDISSEVEELLELEGSEFVEGQKRAPSFLEPSPFLIEPENEPEELAVSEEEAVEEFEEEKPAEGTYDIELLDAGSNKENVIHVLSKLNGLTASPKALVENTPCLIAKGASKNDAESFRLLMLKLGAKVRLAPLR